jgi:multidrug efflux pump subunit AcrA (membrane-fusion protein)
LETERPVAALNPSNGRRVADPGAREGEFMKALIRTLVVFVILAVLGAGGYAWLQGRDDSEAPWTDVVVERGDIVEKAVAIGQIEPRVEFRVKSKVSGIVHRAFVEVGDFVKAGDPLIEIAPDPTPTELVEAERAVESAESAFRKAQTDWERQGRLADEGILASDTADSAREAFEQARIELARRRDALQLGHRGQVCYFTSDTT